MKSKKTLIVGIVIGILTAVGVWAVWYQFIREKTIGEKLEDAGKDVGRSVDKLLKKVQ